MKLIPENLHYFYIDTKDDTFTLGDGDNMFCVLSDYSVQLVCNCPPTYFKLLNDKITTEYGILCYKYLTDGTIHYYLGNDLDLAVGYESDDFDIKFLYKGTYAFIYECPNDKAYIRRISYAKTSFCIPDEYKQTFESVCIIPIKVEIVDDILIETIKRGIPLPESMRFFIDPKDFFTAFRNLWLGLVIFKNAGFIHCDITSRNIIYIDGVFKFIDFDLSFFLSNIRKTVIFKSLVHTVPFCIGMIMIHDYKTRFEPINSSNRIDIDVDSINTSLNNILKINDIYVRDALIKDFNTMNINNFMRSTVPNMLDKKSIIDYYHYLSVYQLSHVMALICSRFGFNRNYGTDISFFLRNCLSHRDSIILSTEDALDLYDTRIMKIFERGSIFSCF